MLYYIHQTPRPLAVLKEGLGTRIHDCMSIPSMYTYLSPEYFSGDHVVTDTSVRNLVCAQLPKEDAIRIDITRFVHVPVGQDL